MSNVYHERESMIGQSKHRPVPLRQVVSGLTYSLRATWLISAMVLSQTANASSVDHDVMWMLAGVYTDTSSDQHRVLTYVARKLTPEQQRIMNDQPGFLATYGKLSKGAGQPAEWLVGIDQNGWSNPSVTRWNEMIGVKQPTEGQVLHKRSNASYIRPDPVRYVVETCMGFGSYTAYPPVSSFVPFPDAACYATPVAAGACNLTVDDVDLGHLKPNQPGNGRATIRIRCDGPAQNIPLTIGPTTIYEQSSNLTVGFSRPCGNPPRTSLDVSALGGATATACMEVKGFYSTTGVKRTNGAITVTYR